MSITKPTIRRITWITVLLGMGTAVHAQLNVVTTTTDLAVLVQAVGGSAVVVHNIVPGVQDPHYTEAKPSYIRRVNRADLLVTIGLDLEVVWLPLLIQGARNPSLAPGSQGYLDASQGIGVLEIPSGPVDRSQGDIHPAGNPHYWLNPYNGLLVAERVAERLSALSPRDAALFQTNLSAFRDQLETQIIDWERRMLPFRGREIVAYHKQWEYLTHWLGLNIIGYVEDKSGVPPSPRHIAKIIERMQKRKVPILLCAHFTPPKIPQQVAQKTGANLLLLLPSVTGELGIETYINLFEHLITKLETTFKEVTKGGGHE